MHGEVRVDADTDLLHDAPIFRKPVDQPEFPEAVGDENTVTEGFGQIGQGFSGTRVVDVSGGDTVCACEQDFIFGRLASAPTLQDAMQRTSGGYGFAFRE